MDVLLLQDVEQLGAAGEIQKVADGFARNFLFPRNLAVIATPGAIKQAEQQQAARVRQKAKALDEAKSFAQALDGLTVTFKARAGEGDRLYGSITSGDIAEALSPLVGDEVDRRKIVLEESIKDLGTHSVSVRLAAEAVATVTVVVERDEE